ncbi:hypothetical protein NQ314_002118 [Rhamnusium bicolor]|uniref:Uncharacterized protein n=1 Tax=Rhamnusium bicolor TaxID=1586634 RepID=A0AAV8ZQQ4_9CUCU|nr:hypothetical protein NQ314_002118 [Rhamnusium bicolor]
MPSETILTEQEQWNYFVRDFFIAAIFQGRFAYCLMSLHAVNPSILTYFVNSDPYPYLWANMVYGITVMIYTRPSLSVIAPFNRMVFGVLGSLMFNHSSMICYDWLTTLYPDSPYLLTFMGFMSGRLMMVHLLAFLYHIDTRSNIPGTIIRRDFAFETMYLY